MDKYALIKKITDIEGLTDEEKASLLELLRTQKKYGIVWEDKIEDVEERLRDELPVLTEVKERRIISADADAPNHILIEGDNLEALTTLAYTHAGKIDVIYIDPPYNTGNNDFVYNDKYVDREDAYKHSKWLSFMSKRLKIAKQLLKDSGVIFISIDDNEQAQLKLLCDEVFGIGNHIGTLPRVTKKSGKDHGDNIAKNHDFLMIYAKDINLIKFNGIEVNSEGYNNIDEYVDTRGKYKLNQTLDYDSLWYNPAMDFPIQIGDEIFYAGGSEQKHKDRHSGIHNPKDWVWRWSQAKFDFGYANGFVEIKSGRGRKRIYTKTYIGASINKNDNGYFIKYIDRESKLSSLAFVENAYSNDNAKKKMAEVIDGNAFDFPKPTSLIETLLELINSNDSIILDFFAGSGTTMHATMQLNAEDGGKRQCILVTNNENNICEEVTYERNRRVIEGYTNAKGEAVEGLKGNNLRYYKTDFVSRERDAKTLRKLVDMSTDMLCIKEDLYDEEHVFGNQKTHKQLFRYFAKGDKKMLVVYREEIIEVLVEEIYAMTLPMPIKVYMFSPSEDPWEGFFEDVADKVELCALPQAIYNAYQRILPKRKDKNIESEFKEEDVPQTNVEEGLLI